MRSDISEPLRRLVTERADHLCEYCLVHEVDVYHGCEVDHVVSVKHGGITVPENLAYACFHCNRHKGTDLGSLSLRTGKLVRYVMSNREIAIDLIQKLPENASLHEIAQEIEFIAGVHEGFEQLERGEGVAAEKVREMVPSWAQKAVWVSRFWHGARGTPEL